MAFKVFLRLQTRSMGPQSKQKLSEITFMEEFLFSTGCVPFRLRLVLLFVCVEHFMDPLRHARSGLLAAVLLPFLQRFLASREIYRVVDGNRSVKPTRSVWLPAVRLTTALAQSLSSSLPRVFRRQWLQPFFAVTK